MPLPAEFVETGNDLPGEVLGYVSVRPKDEASFLDADLAALSDASAFRGDPRHAAAVTRALEEAGLRVIATSALGMAVSGPPEAWKTLTKTNLITYERLVHTRLGRQEYVTHIGFADAVPQRRGLWTSSASDPFDHVVLERPRAAQAVFPTVIPPPVERYHLRVPDDVSLLLNATAAHDAGRRGAGVTVAMVDSGWYRHPFFVAHGYDVSEPITVIDGTDPYEDPLGHGTGESANLFAVAPDATLLPIRAANAKGDLVGALAGFMRAKELTPDVITNSWGGDYPDPVPAAPEPADLVLALEILDAIAQRIVVVFAAGNGTFGVEPQVPGVIAAGGVYADAGIDLRASSYASGYTSPWFKDVNVPTVCGLVGMPPRAAYLLLPIPPGCRIDQERAFAGRGDPPDGTTPFDGWALFSGTSAAAPQIAGAAAVLLGADPDLTPQEVRDALYASALDIRAGRCHPRFDYHAAEGPDMATGAGLIDVGNALAKLPGSDGSQFHASARRGDFVTRLIDQNLITNLLQALTDTKFRDEFVHDPNAALAKLGLKGKVTLPREIKLAPIPKVQRLLDTLDRREPTATQITAWGHRVTNYLGV